MGRSKFPGSWVSHEVGLYGLDGLSLFYVSLFLHSWLCLLPVAISPIQVRTRIRSKDAWGTKDGSEWDLELRLGDLNTCMSFRCRFVYCWHYAEGFAHIAQGVFVVSMTSVNLPRETVLLFWVTPVRNAWICNMDQRSKTRFRNHHFKPHYSAGFSASF